MRRRILARPSPDAMSISYSLILTMGSSLDQALHGLHANIHGCKSLRVAFIVIGDGVNTNEASMKKLLYHYTITLKHHPIRFSIISVRCSSHQCNLIVSTAVCGDEDPDSCDISCNVSRFYKHLLQDFCETFCFNLKRWVWDNLRLVPDDAVADDISKANLQHRADLAALYGTNVLPRDLLKLYNVSLGTLAHSCPAGSDRDVYCRWAWGPWALVL